MDALLGKLTNLAYELFGVIIPGLIFTTFLLLLWVVLGDLAPRWTWSRIPAFSLERLKGLCRTLPGGIAMAATVFGIMWLYLCGHALNWVPRFHPRGQGGWKKRLTRIGAFLRFKPPHPDDYYEPKLKPLFEAINTKFSHDNSALEWRQVYPLARSFLYNTGRYTLLSTYQNKYTLHRSIAAGAAALFWLTVFATIASVATWLRDAPQRPVWTGLLLLAVGSLVLIAGFSSTFLYNWRLWGDTIVTESYAAIFEPTKAEANETQ